MRTEILPIKKQVLLGLVLLTSVGLGSSQGEASDPKAIEKAILHNWETIADRGSVEGGSTLLSVEIGLKKRTKEALREVKQPKPVVVTTRKDEKYDIEIALYEQGGSLDSDYLDPSCLAAAYTYGFGGFYLEALGQKGDTFWGTPGTNAMYKTFYENSGESPTMISIPKAINPELIGDLTFSFYDLDITDATYDGLGKLVKKGGIKTHYLGKIVMPHLNAARINWKHWDKVETNSLAGLCEFYGPDNQLVQQKSKYIKPNDSEVPKPSK